MKAPSFQMTAPARMLNSLRKENKSTPTMNLFMRGSHIGHTGLLKASLHNRLGGLACQDRDLEQLLNTGFSNPLTPADHLSGMYRECVSEELLTTEILPIGILNPPCHHRLIRLVKQVLQRLQARHHPCESGRTPIASESVFRPPLKLDSE
jgi:hypothetical protein